MAPELFPDCDERSTIDDDADNDMQSFCPTVTKETDVYAYGLVSLQVHSISHCISMWMGSSFDFPVFHVNPSYLPSAHIDPHGQESSFLSVSHA
jgi:hypothetical protein